GQITFHESGNRVTYSGAGPGTWEVVKNNVVVILLDKGEKQTITVNPKSGTAVSDGSPEGKGYLRRIRK
ncbi:MAG: hypothetical protein ABIP20_07355, partial [Chthoniobacteraceae bacterium]